MEASLTDDLLSDNQKAALAEEEAAEQCTKSGVAAVGEGTDAEADKASGPLRFEIPVSLPAEIRSEDDMQAVLRKHTAWIDSVLNPNSAIIGGRANLSGADLSGFNLTGVDLRGANFSGANLRGALLSKAILTGANFSGADLQGADLRQAKLRRANLQDADLREADLEEADLRETQAAKTQARQRQQESLEETSTVETPATEVEPSQSVMPSVN